jgi:hypothetical protein
MEPNVQSPTPGANMRRALSILLCLAGATAPQFGATLERLSLEEMTEKSTAIVRGRVVSSRSSLRGPLIYTHFTVQVLERWKGAEAEQVEVAVPGGVAAGLRQTFAGAPELTPGGEYVLFLWTGRSGMTQVIGFSQGVFTLQSDGAGGTLAARAASTEAMLDSKTGQIVNDATLQLSLGALRAKVTSALGGRGRQ